MTVCISVVYCTPDGMLNMDSPGLSSRRC